VGSLVRLWEGEGKEKVTGEETESVGVWRSVTNVMEDRKIGRIGRK